MIHLACRRPVPGVQRRLAHVARHVLWNLLPHQPVTLSVHAKPILWYSWCSQAVARSGRRQALQLSTRRRLYSVYPREGVFQPNSPPHQVLAKHLKQTYVSALGTATNGAPLPPETGHTFISMFKWFCGNLCLYFGFMVGGAAFVVAKFRQAKYMSERDVALMARAFESYEQIPLVQQLRNTYHIIDNEQVPSWQEWVAYRALAPDKERLEQRLTTGPLKGSAGVAAQTVFWNHQTQELFVFVVFGTGTLDNQLEVHPGIIATIFDEALGRVALRKTEARTAVTANLRITYINSVVPRMWYVLRATADHFNQSTESKKYVHGFLTVACTCHELPNDVHNPCNATGSALFVVPKEVDLQPIPDDF